MVAPNASNFAWSLRVSPDVLYAGADPGALFKSGDGGNSWAELPGLTSHSMSLVDIAERVGHTSEAAFNRAFKRRLRQNPGAMRRTLLADMST